MRKIPVKTYRRESYEETSLDAWGHKDSIVFEFLGVHYLTKDEAKKIFGLDNEYIKDELVKSKKKGRFVNPAGLHAYYTRKGIFFRKSELEIDEMFIGPGILGKEDLEELIANLKK